jgi:ribosomal protein S18 acetylase RimI-like enzyme
MPMPEIRRATLSDIEATVAVWERARWDAQPWLEERMGHSHEDNLRHFRDVVMRDDTVWLAIDGHEVVGLLALGERLVAHLYVEPARQGRGIGTALLDLAKRDAPEGLTLFTHQRNERARTFYERRGFRAVEFGRSPPPENEPDVKYRWDPRAGADPAA